MNTFIGVNSRAFLRQGWGCTTIIRSFVSGESMSKEIVTDEELEKPYKIIAKIVRDYGDKYLPIFQRIHDEVERRKANQGLKDIALQIAQNER